MPGGVKAQRDYGILQSDHGQADATAEMVVVPGGVGVGVVRWEDVVVGTGAIEATASTTRRSGTLQTTHDGTGTLRTLHLAPTVSVRPTTNSTDTRLAAVVRPVIPIPDPHLKAQASTGHDVAVDGMVLDRPRGAGMALQVSYKFAGGAARDLDGVIAVRRGQGPPVGGERQRDGGHGRSGRDGVRREDVGNARVGGLVRRWAGINSWWLLLLVVVV